jgi:hypothetical protein
MARLGSIADRFHQKYEKIPIAGCWIWTAAVTKFGHGLIKVNGGKEERVKAHRLSYLLHKGEITKGLNVLHQCGVAACVNPDHLYLGTQKENARDMMRHGRHFLPDNNGENAAWAKLTESDVLEIIAAKPDRKYGTGTELARRFNVSKAAIYQIWNNKNWTCLSQNRS